MRANLGWNTWDVFHVNGVVHLESGIRIRFILVDAETGERKERFDWQNDLSQLGPHSGRVLGICPDWAALETGCGNDRIRMPNRIDWHAKLTPSPNNRCT